MRLGFFNGEDRFYARPLGFGELLECASASKWDPTFAGIKFLNRIVNLRN